MKASKFFMLKRKREAERQSQAVEVPATEEQTNTISEVPQAETVVELEKVEEVAEKTPVEVKKSTNSKKKA